MPRGRRKGSTGTYSKWPPERIAELWLDADLLADRHGRVDKKLVAKRLKKELPKKYQYDTEEQLRQQLSKKYQSKKWLNARDAFNAAVLARMLGEK
jgi:hypothetical protein